MKDSTTATEVRKERFFPNMALSTTAVKKTNVGSRNTTLSTKSTRPLIKKVVLPTSFSEPDYDIEKATIFFYGEEKVGKTSLAAQFPDPLFMMFEPGAKWLRIKRLPEEGQFNTWTEAKNVVEAIVASGMYKNIVFDTADLAYELTESHICEESGEETINEGKLGYNKGNNKASSAFKKLILDITATGRGVIFLSHAKSQSFVRSTGVTYDKIVPTASDRVKRFLKGFVDITAYCGYYGDDNRYIVVQGDQSLDAGHRVDGRFLTTTGKPVHGIPMGDNAKEAYTNFVNAFNNKQREQNNTLRKASISDVKVKFVKK